MISRSGFFARLLALTGGFSLFLPTPPATAGTTRCDQRLESYRALVSSRPSEHLRHLQNKAALVKGGELSPRACADADAYWTFEKRVLDARLDLSQLCGIKLGDGADHPLGLRRWIKDQERTFRAEKARICTRAYMASRRPSKTDDRGCREDLDRPPIRLAVCSFLPQKPKPNE